MIKIPKIKAKITLNCWSFVNCSSAERRVLTIECFNNATIIQRKYLIAETANSFGTEAKIQIIEKYIDDCLKLAKNGSVCTIKLDKKRNYIYFVVSPTNNAPDDNGIKITGSEI